MRGEVSHENKPDAVFSPISYAPAIERRIAQAEVQKKLAENWANSGAKDPKTIEETNKELKKLSEELLAAQESLKQAPRQEKTPDFWVELSNFDTQTKIRVGEIDFMDSNYRAYVNALMESNPDLKPKIIQRVAEWSKEASRQRSGAQKKLENPELKPEDKAKLEGELAETFRSARFYLRNQTEVEFGAIADHLRAVSDAPGGLKV